MGVAPNKTGGLHCPCSRAGLSALLGWQAKAGGFWYAVCFAVSEMASNTEGERGDWEEERCVAVLQASSVGLQVLTE